MVDINIFGNDTVFHHVGLAVQSIKDVIGDETEIVADDIQRVSVAFIQMGKIMIELIEPLNELSPVNSSIEKGMRLVHLCFQVDDLDKAIEEGRKRGFHRIAKSVPAKALKNKRIAWVFSKTYGLIELLEK